MTLAPVVVTRDAGTGATTLAVGAELGFDGDGRTVEALASAYGKPYPVTELGRTFTETIHPGAATESLRTITPICQWRHGADPAVGQAPIMTLDTVRDQRDGLYFRGRLLDAPQLDLIRSGLRSGAITGASIRMQVPLGGDRWSADNTRRDPTRMKVLELGPVIWPANPAAVITARTGRPLSPRAQRSLDAVRAGVLRWTELPAPVRAELTAARPTRVAALRALDAIARR